MLNGIDDIHTNAISISKWTIYSKKIFDIKQTFVIFGEKNVCEYAVNVICISRLNANNSVSGPSRNQPKFNIVPNS